MGMGMLWANMGDGKGVKTHCLLMVRFSDSVCSKRAFSPYCLQWVGGWILGIDSAKLIMPVCNCIQESDSQNIYPTCANSKHKN